MKLTSAQICRLCLEFASSTDEEMSEVIIEQKNNVISCKSNSKYIQVYSNGDLVPLSDYYKFQ